MWTITKGSLASKNMPNICVLHAFFYVTSGNKFDAQKFQEDEIFERQDILRSLSEGSKDYEYAIMI